MKIKVMILKEKCKGCGLCMSVCKRKVLEMSPEKETNQKGYAFVRVIYPEKCTGCASCVTICPDAVVEIYKEE